MQIQNQSRQLVIAAAIVGLGFVPILRAQQRAATLSHSDSSFVSDAAEGGMNEVRLGGMAQEKASNEHVKAFGKRMADDHGRMNSELQALAAQKGITLPTDVGLTQKASDKLLSTKSGHSFDEAYVSNMVKDHKDDIEAFEKEANSGVDPDVRAFASKALPTLREHLKMANDLQREVGTK